MILINLLIVFVTFAFMEWVAWFTHKYIMHGFMWRWHKSHHVPHEESLEKNDLFAVVFSLLSISLFIAGTFWDKSGVILSIASGITMYGAAYFIFHDIIVHRRIKINFVAKSEYMKRIIRAHKIHHKVLSKNGATTFGFLWASKKY